jgi:L-rhamnose mutarotase
MEIYLSHNRLIMLMETEDNFNPEHKAEADAHNLKVQEWENLMWKYQQKIPWANENEKWVDAELVFKLSV